MPAVSTARMTVEQYLDLGEDPAGLRLELVDGEIEVSPSPNWDHSHVDRMLGNILHNHILAYGLGDLFGGVDTLLDEYNVRRPDLLFFRKEKARQLVDKRQRIMPDLAVEIVSPTSMTTDSDRKFAQYQQAGIENYWIVDPGSKTLIGWTLQSDGYVEAGRGENDQSVSLPPFPDLAIPLHRLWRS